MFTVYCVEMDRTFRTEYKLSLGDLIGTLVENDLEEDLTFRVSMDENKDDE